MEIPEGSKLTVHQTGITEHEKWLKYLEWLRIKVTAPNSPEA